MAEWILLGTSVRQLRSTAHREKEFEFMGLFNNFKKTATPKGQDANSSAVTFSPPSLTKKAEADRSDGVIVSREKRLIEKRLLFVNVEAGWYQAVEHDLAKLEPTWGCLLAQDVEQAVAALQKEHFHALILSSQIAGQPTIIPAIMKQPPSLVRIVLCDGSNRAEMARWNASGASPLPQSTDGAGIATNVSRIARVQEWMMDVGMKNLLAQCRKLPATPKLYSEVTTELSSPNGSINVVAQCIAKDPVMTAKLLQVVNSAFFALGRQISDPSEAVMFLGSERTRSLILLSGVFTQFEGVKCPGFSSEQIWNHSLQVAALARNIARTETTNTKMVEAAFTAGLLHDMGKLILAANVPAMCNSFEQLHQSKKLSQREAELQV